MNRQDYWMCSIERTRDYENGYNSLIISNFKWNLPRQIIGSDFSSDKDVV